MGHDRQQRLREQQQQFERYRENFLLAVDAICQRVTQLDQVVFSGRQVDEALLRDIKRRIEALEVIYGHRGNVGSRFKLFKSEAECNELFQPIMEGLSALFPRTDTTSIQAKLEAFLAKPKVAEFVRALIPSANSSSQNLEAFQQLIADEPGFSGKILSIGNNINFELTVDGRRFVLAVKKKSDRSQRATYELNQVSETASFLIPVIAERKYLSVAEEGEFNKLDTVSIVPYLPKGDVFSYGEGLSLDDRLTAGIPLFYNMANMMQTLLQRGAVMMDMKGTNLLVGENETLSIADQKTMVYLQDLQELRDVPRCSRLFQPDSHEDHKFIGDGALDYSKSFMTHLLGLNLAIFLLGYTENSLDRMCNEGKFRGNSESFKAFILQQLSESVPENNPLRMLAEDLLQQRCALEQAYTRLTAMRNAMPATSSQTMNVVQTTNVAISQPFVFPHTVPVEPLEELLVSLEDLQEHYRIVPKSTLKQEVKREKAPAGEYHDLDPGFGAKSKDPFVDVIHLNCIKPLEELILRQQTRSGNARFGGRRHKLAEEKIKVIEDMLTKMRVPIQKYENSAKDEAAKTACSVELVESIQASLKTKNNEDTPGYIQLKRCSNKIVDYLIRGLLTASGALAVVGLFSSYKKFGFRTDSHATAHNVLEKAKELPTKTIGKEDLEETQSPFPSPHRH
jgi:hypothetical protein